MRDDAALHPDRSLPGRWSKSNSRSAEPLAVYGLGEMGAAIATCLLRSGRTVLVFDPAITAGWSELGAIVSASIPEAATRTTTHLIVVRQPADLDALLLEPTGIGTTAPPGSLIVVHTTTSPTHLRWLAAQLVELGGHTTLDAALGRRTGAVEDGSLSLFVGATAQQYRKHKATLSAYADNVVHAGALGSGMAVKLLNNWLLYANRLAMIQATGVADRLDIDREVLLAALSTSSGGSWVVDHFSDIDRAILAGSGAPRAITERTLAELTLAVEMASALNTSASSLTTALELVEAMQPAARSTG